MGLSVGPLDPCLIANLRCLSLKDGSDITTRQGQVTRHSIWAALRNAGTRLSSLTVQEFDGAVDDMFDYLRSYSGLAKLNTTGHYSDDGSVGQVFWNEIVPNHADSLVELQVSSSSNGIFCYGPSAASAIRRCKSLRKLALSVCEVDRAWVSGRIAELRDNRKGWDLRCGPDVICTLPHITVCNDHI